MRKRIKLEYLGGVAAMWIRFALLISLSPVERHVVACSVLLGAELCLYGVLQPSVDVVVGKEADLPAMVVSLDFHKLVVLFSVVKVPVISCRP